MSQAEIKKLIPNLRIIVNKRYRNLRTKQGPEGRLNKIGEIVTTLFKEERIQLHYQKADEARGYAERLIAEAIKYGDTHQPTMEIADFYLKDKQMIHKLFKVLVPRFKNSQESYTNLFFAPTVYPDRFLTHSLLELKGNPFPPMRPEKVPTNNWIHNILMEEARREYSQKKATSEETES